MRQINRLIIIGNGFDLAHGLPTRYVDFINWYWEKWINKLWYSSKKLEEDPLCSFKLLENLGGWYLAWSYRYGIAIIKDVKPVEIVNELLRKDTDGCEFKFKSEFFSFL